jgi:hypothetical protein
VEEGFDDGHIFDCVFERDGDFGVFEDCFGECVALQRVLIANGEGFGGKAVAEEVFAIVDEEACGPVWRRIERDFYLNASTGPEELDPLVGHDLRAAGEDGLTAGEVQNRRRETIRVHLGVAVDTGDDPARLLCESIAGCVDEITADVHEGTAAAVHLIADIRRVDVEGAEKPCDGPELADAALGEQFTKPKPLRVAADHESLVARTATTSEYFARYSSNYHSLQVKFDHRMSRGFAITNSYTYGKALGFLSEASDYPNGLLDYVNQRAIITEKCKAD